MPIAVESFLLNPSHTGTLQRQVQDLVTDGILAGRFRPGDRLPSSRKLAVHLGLSRITVTLAYTELVANDYLTSRGRSGYFVSDQAPAPVAPPTPMPGPSSVDWPRTLGGRIGTSLQISRPENWQSYRYPFIYGQPDQRLFDHQSWRRCAMQALGRRDFDALTADAYEADDPELVAQIIRLILPRRGIAARPDQVLITLGAQNALWTAAQVLLTQRRTAAMEYPCYPVLRDILTQSRCNTTALSVDHQGLRPESIPPETDVLFTTPSHHCPTSVTLPLARRRALLEQARRDDFLIVEDDYEFELAFMSQASPALKSLDTDGRVIYIGSFSKSLFPGLRLGYMVAPAPVIREARALRGLVMRHPPGHIQRFAAYYLAQGYYDAQIQRTARAFKTRREVLDACLTQHGLRAASRNAFGGSSVWMQTEDGVNADTLAERLRTRSVLIEPGAAFFRPRDPRAQGHFRLGYSSISETAIPAGVALIAEEQAKLQRERGG